MKNKMELRDLSVIIATREGAALLPMALAHLEVQTCPAARFEVIVADCGPAGGEASNLVERYSAGAPVRTRCLRLPNSSAARARNVAATEARGRRLLFLDEELLAGPGLVEAHLRALEGRPPETVLVGRVQMHPQIPPKTFTKRYPSGPPDADPGTPLGLHEWGFHNLSLAREPFLAVGGFPDYLGFDGLQDLALAWRLRSLNLSAYPVPDAVAYTWKPTRLPDERRRAYLNGYSLLVLTEQLNAPDLRKLFPAQPGRCQSCLDRLLQPIYRQLCMPRSPDTRSFRALSARILDHDFCRGYSDAAAGRPAYFDGRRYADGPAGTSGRTETLSSPGLNGRDAT